MSDLEGTANKVDRTGWPKGPWDDEPDRVDWKTRGCFPAIALRHFRGHWCGYVGVPAGHPAYGRGYDDEIEVHGGVTYAAKCAGRICHVPEPGESDDVWWLGFDFDHSEDAAPWSYIDRVRPWVWRDGQYVQLFGRYAINMSSEDISGVYRDLVYVRSECERAAKQLAKMVRKPT
jgi:hypothetical protein